MNAPAPTSHESWISALQPDTRTICRVTGELIEGFQKMADLGPCVSLFGSSRIKPGHRYYKLATEVAEDLSKAGFGVITGGGPGIMEAGNKGAQSGTGSSIGLNLHFSFEEGSNPYIDPEKDMTFKYFFVRKVMFVKYSSAIVVFPGGYGTLDELFEALTLIQTEKITPVPVILVGSDFWSGLLDWLNSTLLSSFKTIGQPDLQRFQVVDSSEKVMEIIHRQPNSNRSHGILQADPSKL